MARVKIRKAGPGEKAGYYNKTAMFLKKAQEGTEVQSEEGQGQAQEEIVQAYYQYAQQQLSNETPPDKVYTELVSNGLPEKVAYQIITSLMEQLVEAGVLNPDYKRQKEEQAQQEQPVVAEETPTPAEPQAEDPAMFEENQDLIDNEEEYLQDRSYMADGGMTYTADDYDGQNNMFSQYDQVKDNTVENFDLNTLIANTPGIQPSLNFPSLSEYIPEYQNVEWTEQNPFYDDSIDYQKNGGMVKKKQFVKNVMSLLKKAEGGEGEEDTTLGKGNPMDTLTEDVKKHKNNFLSAVKTKATTAKTEEMYDMLKKSNDPDLQQLGMQAFQVGGMTGGQDPLFRFFGGGDQPDYYEADFLPEAAYGYSTGNLRRAQNGDAGKKLHVETGYSNPPTYMVKDELGNVVFSTKNIGEAQSFVNGENTGQKFVDESTKGMSKRQKAKWIQEQLLLRQQQTPVIVDGIPNARINYVPNYVTGPGSSLRSLTPWNPMIQSRRTMNQVGMPHIYGTNIPYKDPLAGMTPVAREVTKTGIFGRPKRYTDIYSIAGAQGIGDGNIMADANRLIFPQRNQQGKVDISLPEEQEENYSRERPLANFLLRSGIPGLTQLGSRMYPWENNGSSETELTNVDPVSVQANNVPTQGIRAFVNDQLNTDLNRTPYQGPPTEFGEYAPYNPDMINMQERYGFPDYYDFGAGIPNTSMSYGGNIPKAQGGLTINNPNLPQPAPANPDLALGSQAGLLGSVTQGPNTSWAAMQSFNQPAPTSQSVQAYNNNPANNIAVEPMTDDLMNCTPEQKNDTTSKCYCSPEARKNPQDKRCYEGGKVAVDFASGRSKTTDPEAYINVGNALVSGVANRVNKRQANAAELKMYDNLSSNNLYASQGNKHRGDWVDFGSGLGNYRYDQAGSERNSFSSYGKLGGFMQDGGQADYAEGAEVYMTDEDIANFRASGGQIEYI